MTVHFNNIIVGTSFFFVGGILSFLITPSLFCERQKSEIPQNNITSSTVTRFGIKSVNKNTHLPETFDSIDDFASFLKQIEKKKTPEEFEKLFDSLIGDPQTSHNSERMAMLLSKWGEIAPRQAIDKVLQSPLEELWLACIFSGWAGKDPETVAHYYDETKNKSIKNSYFVLNRIVSQWAQHSPAKAIQWLDSYKKEQPKLCESVKQSIIPSLAKYKPDYIPELVSHLDKKELEMNAFSLGKYWSQYHPESIEWIEKLPEKDKKKALAGSLLGKTKGNLNELEQEVSQLSRDDQLVIIRTMAVPLLNVNGLKKEEVINWLIEKLPEALTDKNIQYFLRPWLHENRIDAQKWIDTLPEGKNKENILELYNSPPMLYF